MVLLLALRNTWRNGRRSLLTLGGIALAIAIMLTAVSLQNGAWNTVISAAIQSTAGHVVVQAPGWQERREASLVLERSSGVQAALQRAYPEATVVRRTFVGGLMTSPTSSQAVSVQGVEPGPESTLTLLDDRLTQGEWLTDDRSIVMGETLATTLGVALGDKVVLMAQIGTEDMESRLYRVRGLFRTGNDGLDGFVAFATLASTQTFMSYEDPAHQVAVVLPSVGRGLMDTGAARAALADREDVQVLSWNEALPTLQEQERIDRSFNLYLVGLMGMIVGIGVLNTALMSVMERMREFGVLLAIGMRPRGVAGMIVLESTMVGILGAVAGVLLSGIPTTYLMTVGIDLGDLMSKQAIGGNAPIDPVIYGAVEPSQIVFVATSAAVMSVLASLYPARKTLKLSPVEAMHHQ